MRSEKSHSPRPPRAPRLTLSVALRQTGWSLRSDSQAKGRSCGRNRPSAARMASISTFVSTTAIGRRRPEQSRGQMGSATKHATSSGGPVNAGWRDGRSLGHWQSSDRVRRPGAAVQRQLRSSKPGTARSRPRSSKRRPRRQTRETPNHGIGTHSASSRWLCARRVARFALTPLAVAFRSSADLRRTLAALPDDTPDVDWGRRFLADRATRSVAPGCFRSDG